MEIQSQDLEEIAKVAAANLSKHHTGRLMVEDSGLFIRALDGFPGPFSSYVYDTLGTRGVLRLMKPVRKRDAYFQCSVACVSPNTGPIVFTGKTLGRICHRELGKNGFGFDPIFIPVKSKKTFAQMSAELKNQWSHRARAFRKFADWYLSR